MANVCLTCGDKGVIDLLIYCRKCRDAAVHHYCMDNVSPDDDDIRWWCWECASSESNAEPSRKSKRIRAKRQKVRSTRSYWKERLNKNQDRAWNGNGSDEIHKSTTEDHLCVANVEIQLSNEIQRDDGIQEEKISGPEVPSHSDNCDESIRIDDPMLARESTVPSEEESGLELFDPTLEIRDVSRNQILVLNDSTKCLEEYETSDIQVPSLAACTTLEMFYSQNSWEPESSIDAEPIADPIWRGWFNLEDDSSTDLEILAHLSDKACQKASAAATAIPTVLDIQLLDKNVVWPKSFIVSPPTAACIALYFFPARDRVEREFDSLLDEVIERDLALRATVNDMELLIFTSRELPLQHWRYRSKYYLWGVFRKKQRVCWPNNSSGPHQNSSTEFPYIERLP